MNLSQTSKIVLSVLAFAGIAIGLSTFKYPTLQRLNAVNFLALQANIITAELTTTINNHHLIPAHLVKMKANVFIDERFVGEAASDEQIQIKAHDTSQIQIKTKIDLKSFAELFAAMENQKEAVVIKVDGRYTINGYFKEIVIKAVTEQEIDLRQQLKTMINAQLSQSGVHIQSVESKQVSVSQSKMMAKVALRNPFPFDYTLKAVDLDLFVGDQRHKIGNWSLQQVQQLQAKEEALIIGAININNFSILGRLDDILNTEQKGITARGYASVEIAGNIFKFPVQQRIPMTDILF